MTKYWLVELNLSKTVYICFHLSAISPQPDHCTHALKDTLIQAQLKQLHTHTH